MLSLNAALASTGLQTLDLKKTSWLKTQFPDKDYFLFVDENCKECDRLIEQVSKKCSLPKLKNKLAVLAFGKEMKLKTKLWKLRQITTQKLALSELKSFAIIATPSLWKLSNNSSIVGVSRILAELKKGGAHGSMCAS